MADETQSPEEKEAKIRERLGETPPKAEDPKPDPPKPDPPKPEPAPDPKPDPELEKIIEQADKPDAVRNAIRKHQDAAKEAREESAKLAAQVKEYEDRDKSEQEKLEERAAESDRRAKEAEERLLRYQVATAKNLPPALAARLQGNDQTELEEDADRLLELMKPGQPAGDVDAGKGQTEVKEPTMNDILRRKAGKV